MIDDQTLQEIVRLVVTAARPSRLILFGSYGRGDADAASDLDILVIQPQVDNQYEEMIRLHKTLGPGGGSRVHHVIPC